MESAPRVLIAGAGIAGPTLAFWLLRAGFIPTLVEQAPAFRAGGYMLDFWGVGYDVAERMGLLPRLEAAGYHLREVRLVDAQGHRVGGFGAEVFRRPLGGRFLSIPRGELARQIFDTVSPRIETLFGDSVSALESAAEGVRVSFERQPPRRFDLVVGADGLHSTVRRLAFGPQARYETSLGYLAASFTATGYAHRDEGAYVSYSFPGAQVARYSLRDDRTGFFLVLHPAVAIEIDPHDRAAHDALLESTFGGRGWECDEMLAALERADDLYFDRVSQIRMPRWSHRRIALVGDAAFCPSLLAGQGAALAMAGAYVLAAELAHAAGDYRRAYQAYHERLASFIERKQHAALRFGAWFAPRTRLALHLRNVASRMLAVPAIADLAMGPAFADHVSLPEAA